MSEVPLYSFPWFTESKLSSSMSSGWSAAAQLSWARAAISGRQACSLAPCSHAQSTASLLFSHMQEAAASRDALMPATFRSFKFQFAQHSPTTRPSVERTADKVSSLWYCRQQASGRMHTSSMVTGDAGSRHATGETARAIRRNQAAPP